MPRVAYETQLSVGGRGMEERMEEKKEGGAELEWGNGEGGGRGSLSERGWGD